VTKAKKFRELLNSPELESIYKVHNVLSAKIVEGAGFRCPLTSKRPTPAKALGLPQTFV